MINFVVEFQSKVLTAAAARRVCRLPSTVTDWSRSRPRQQRAEVRELRRVRVRGADRPDTTDARARADAHLERPHGDDVLRQLEVARRRIEEGRVRLQVQGPIRRPLGERQEGGRARRQCARGPGIGTRGPTRYRSA